MTGYLPSLVYLLCFAASCLCAYMLGRSYRRSRASLLWWSSICFALLAINNLLLIVDLMVITAVSLQLPRMIINLAAVSTLLFGFIWNGED